MLRGLQVMDFPGDPGLSLNVARQRLGDLAQLLSNDDWVMEVGNRVW